VNAAFTVGLDTLGLVKGFAVAAFLTAEEYGIWGILVIALGTLGLIKEGVIGDKFVQQDEADQERAFRQAFTLEAALNGILLLVMLAALPLFTLAYGQSDLFLPGLVVIAAVPLATFQSPLWIFYRSLRFYEQRKLQAADPVVSFVVTLGLAAAGLGYWSLVVGVVAGRLAGAIVAVMASPYKLGWEWDRGALRSYVSFAGPLFVATICRVAGIQVLMLVAEPTLGLAGVGALVLASSLRVYTDRVDAIVTQTLYPAVARVRDRRDLLLESFTKSNRLGLMWGVPFGVAMALFAEDLAIFALGDEWVPAIGLLQAFGLIAAFNHIGYNWTAFFRARGETRPIATNAVVGLGSMLLITVPAMVVWERDGLIAGFAISAGITVAMRTWYLTRLFPSFQIFVHSARAMAPTVPAAAAVLAIRALEGGERTGALALGELAVFVAVTAVATALIERPLLREVRGYLRRPGTSPA
jgi:PST family polysaccharide transporter